MMKTKTRNSLYALLIMVILFIIVFIISYLQHDKLGPWFGVTVVYIFVLTICLLISSLLLIADQFKMINIRSHFIFNFFSTATILLGIVGFFLFFSKNLGKSDYLLPFVASLLVGVIMSFKIDK